MGLNDALRKLNLVDTQLRGLDSRLSGARRHAKTQAAKLDQLQQQARELTQQLKTAQAAAATLENEINSANERIDQLRERMNTVTNNKEYSAMLVEVNTLKADRSKVEDRQLEVMSQVESHQAELEGVQEAIAEQTKITQMAEKELADRTAEVSEQIDQLKQERGAAASEVPAEALTVFDRLADTYEGEAMAPIIEEDRRRLEYVCGGCYMQIPVEKVNQLVTADQLVRCTSCSRILYLESELKEAMGSG